MVDRGIDTLPFLFKLLAAEKPLSIQCHPSLEKAKAEYEIENNNGISKSAPNRNYKDPNHKPELIVAAPSMLALCNFRPYEEIEKLFK